ncbi:MAG TPA: C4-dicarboxylate TRAP transporter substrate-binding protein [Brevibacillus sp.]|nr:C4-dicarboxylate TRAP transporter substrate-binding protein [Brevibacillus sp.]
MKKSVKRFVSTLLIAMLAVTAAGCGSNGAGSTGSGTGAGAQTGAAGESKLKEKLVLRMGHVMTETEPSHQAALEFAKKVEERTNGDIKVQVFPNSTLGSDPEVMEQAKLGNPMIAYTNPTYLVDMAKDLSIIGGPFLVNDWEELKKIIDSDFMKEQEEILKNNDLRVLAFNWYFGSRHVITNKEIKTPEDLNGVKVRSQPSPLVEETIKAMGAIPTPMAWAEVYPGIEQKVIEGAEAPFSTLYSSKLHEVATSISKTGHFSQVNGWVMSEKIFSSLPQEYQEILLEEAKAAGEKMSQETIKQSEEFEQKLIAEGVKIVEPDIEAFREATKVVYKNLEQSWTPGLYDRIQKILEQ